MAALPIIDLSSGAESERAGAIDAACRDTGFFYVVGHGVAPELVSRLDALAREFFALPDEEKSSIAMRHGGRAWRGWFPLGGELTSGVPDRKEGLYFGEELGAGDPRVRAGLPLHGANLFPDRPAGLRDAVLEYVTAVTGVGHALLRGVSSALGLDEDWFDRHLTASPTVLFRIFRYPPLVGSEAEARTRWPDAGTRWPDAGTRWPDAGTRWPVAGTSWPVAGTSWPVAGTSWSVGEHTDYGLLTILAQDASGGLEVRGRDGWVAAPPIDGSFVVNLGDMLERMTGGRYRSTPHRVRNPSARDRLSFPLFLDPAWDAEVLPAPNAPDRPDGLETDRWDGVSVHDWSGTYGDYLLAKVSKVFPALLDDVMP